MKYFLVLSSLSVLFIALVSSNSTILKREPQLANAEDEASFTEGEIDPSLVEPGIPEESAPSFTEDEVSLPAPEPRIVVEEAPAPRVTYVSEEPPRVSSYEAKDCDGSHSAIIRYYSNGRKEVIQDLGAEPGVCGNSVRANIEPAPITGSFTEEASPARIGSYEARDCSGNHAAIIRFYSNGRKEVVEDLGTKEGECGVSSRSTISDPPPTTGRIKEEPSEARIASYEARDCSGDHSAIIRFFSNGRKELVKDEGKVKGLCGVPVDQNFPEPTPATAVIVNDSVNPRIVSSYEARECSANRTVIKRFFSDIRTPELVRDIGPVAGECGNPSIITLTPAAPANPAPVFQAPEQRIVTSYDARECLGNNSVIKRFFSDGRNPQFIQTIGPIPGECGNPSRIVEANSEIIPTTILTAPTPIEQRVITSYDAHECSGNSTVVKRFFSDFREPELISNLGIIPGECGVPLRQTSV